MGIHLFEEDELMVDRMAYPIDPRMKKIDIVGAKHIFLNREENLAGCLDMPRQRIIIIAFLQQKPL